MSDVETTARRLWRECGGGQYGPNVEHVDMPLSRFGGFATRFAETISREAREKAARERDEAYRYGKHMLECFVAKHFPPNPNWSALPDLIGLMTQIDNAMCVADELRAQLAEAREALELAEGHLDEMRTDPKWHPIGHCPVLDQVRTTLAKLQPDNAEPAT